LASNQKHRKSREGQRTGAVSFVGRRPSLHHFKLAEVVDHNLDFWRRSEAIVLIPDRVE